MTARVIVLAGPSGAGKSRLAERLQQRYGWPTLRLDDFYLDLDAPDLPRITDGANAGLIDWDDAATWDRAGAVAAIARLCRTGAVDVPEYSLAGSRRTGWGRLELNGAPVFCAEGIFAPDVVAECAAAGLLAHAYCVTQHPAVTFTRRLSRDLRERRKPPMVLLRRGWSLARAQRGVVRRAMDAGCRVATGDVAFAEISTWWDRSHATP